MSIIQDIVLDTARLEILEIIQEYRTGNLTKLRFFLTLS